MIIPWEEHSNFELDFSLVSIRKYQGKSGGKINKKVCQCFLGQCVLDI